MDKLTETLAALYREQRMAQMNANASLKHGDINSAVREQRHALTVSIKLAETRQKLFVENAARSEHSDTPHFAVAVAS